MLNNNINNSSILKGGEQIISRLDKIIQKFDSECKASQGTLILKSSSDLQRLLISILNDILQYGFKLESYQHQDQLNITNENNFYSVYQIELNNLLSIKYINQISSANTDKKKAFLWLLLELQGKTINLTIREIQGNDKLLACYDDSSLIKSQLKQVKKLISQLEAINYQIEGDIITRYKKFYVDQEQKEILENKQKEKQREQEKKDKEQEKEQEQEKAKQVLDSQKLMIQSMNDRIQQNAPQQIKSSSIIDQDQLPKVFMQETRFTSDYKPPNSLFQMFKQTNENEKQYQQETILPIHLTANWKQQGKKPSQQLYDEIYKEICEHVHSKFQQKQDQTMTLKDQDNKCWSCQRKVSTGFYQFGSNCDYCYYSGRWHCTECLSEQRTPIPWKALEQFDLKHYKVSLISYDEIQKLYDVPMLEVDYNSQIVQKSKTLFEFMVLKRQIHLLYDMICDPNLVQQLLDGRINLCLKKNLLSLKNFYEIYNGSLYKLLEGYYNILCKHVLYCKSCQKRGQVCKICKSVSVVHAFDIRNITYCDKCKNLYHRACLEESNCPHCLVHNK